MNSITHQEDATMKIPKKYHQYKTWTLDSDNIGSISYVNGEMAIYCTPNWDGVDGLGLEIVNYETDQTEYVNVTTLRVNTAKVWFELVKPYLDKYMKNEIQEVA